jgi:Recombination endonuclease VII
VKQCSRCKETKPLSEFNKDKRRKDCLTYHCKKCVSYYGKTRNGVVDRKHINELGQIWKKKNPDKVRAQWVKQMFGLSYTEYLSLYEKQHASCAICKTPLLLYGSKDDTDKIANVDHCHTTGKVRGLLCRKCNTALGLFNDNITAIKMAAEYLETNND